MRRQLLCAAFVVAVCLAQAQEDDAAYEEPAYDDDQYEDQPSAGEGRWIDEVPYLRELTGRLQRAVDAESLVKARRWGNIANGLLLGVTGPVALAISAFGMKLSNIVLSLYVTAFGGLLTSLELSLEPVAPWAAENLSYLSTAAGRTALLVFAGNLVWAFGRMGLVPALLTCLNALFNANFNSILAFVQEDDVVDVTAGDDEGFDPGMPAEEDAPAEEEEPMAEPMAAEPTAAEPTAAEHMAEPAAEAEPNGAPAGSDGGASAAAEAPGSME